MIYAADIALTILLVSAFCVAHSFLASNKIKIAIKNKFGKLIAFYRVAYNIFSFASFYAIYLLVPKNNLVIYDLPFPYDLVVFSFQVLSILGLIWCTRYFSSGEFFGFNQIKRYKEGNYNPNDLDEKSDLRIEGPYKYSRHPVYFFSIMFLVMRPIITLTYLIIVVIFVLYFYIGSIFEEKRLVEKFGDAYVNYQKSVPRIIPVKVFNS